MKVANVSFICLILMQAKLAFGQELALPPDLEFQAYRRDLQQRGNEQVEIFVPLNLQPTNSTSGFYQQILQHQLHQMQSYGLPVYQFEHWNGELNLSHTPESGIKPEVGAMSIYFQPFTTQSAVKFQDIGQLKVNHQVFLKQTEYRLCPDGSHWSLSHIDNRQESKERLMYGIDW